MPGLMHESTIDVLCSERGFLRNGFPKAFKDVMVPFHECQDAMDHFVEDEMMEFGVSRDEAVKDWRRLITDERKRYSPGFLPDCFSVCHHEQKIVCVEVENTSRITDRKFALYLEVWFLLDCMSWSLELHVYDRFGKLTNALSDDDLCKKWWTYTAQSPEAASA